MYNMLTCQPVNLLTRNEEILQWVIIILYRLVTEHYFCNFATENKISNSPYGTFQYSRRI